MKKAYTLAEVFITLCIILIVLSMTLPTLLGASKTSGQVAKEHPQRVEKSVKYDYDFTK